MKNNTSIIFNIVLAIAVAILYVLHFSSKKESGPAMAAVADTASANGPLTVYVNGDSLLNNYEYFKEIKKAYEAKTDKIQKDMIAKRTALEREFGAYQQNAAGMSPEQRARVEEGLMRKQQELSSYGEKEAAKLADEEMKLNEELFDNVSGFLKEYSKGKSYKIVMNYTRGTGILFANDSLDITREVLEGLNKSHLATKK